MNISILGAGAWGLAMAIALSQRHQVCLWGRDSLLIENAKKTRRSQVALPGFSIPESIQLTSVFEEAIKNVQTEDSLLLIATPVAGLREVTNRVNAFTISNLVWLCKGFEELTAYLPHQVVQEALKEKVPIGVLSGPSFAQEVAKGLPCALTIASSDENLQKRVVKAANFGHMRIYSSSDMTGVEVGGAIKNILAIATGICDGMGLGANARAALMTRGLAEVTRLGMALGGHPQTFMGLTGMGDLILTCTGDLSRNRQVGLALAKGKSLETIVHDLGHVAEGVRCAQAVKNIATKLQIEMPITDAVADVLFNGVSPQETIERLMSRSARSE